MTARLLIGDVHERLADIPDSSVDLVVTSPPFLALRSYLPPDHPDKTKEIGSEATPAAFLDTLLALTVEWRRILTPYGSICVELGDTYAGSGGAGGDYNADGLREGQQKFSGSAHKRALLGVGDDYRPARSGRSPDAWPLDKSLSGIPTLYTWSLAYGHNLLNPDHRIDPWRIRNLLTWTRPNPPVGALGDKFRPATSFVTVATMARDRWFDLDAVRGPGSPNTHARLAKGADPRPTNGKKAENPNNNYGSMNEVETAGAPPLDWDAPDNWDQLFADALDQFLAGWWQPLTDLPTQPYKGAHYATFPLELPKRLIEAMCPRQVCVQCGEPRRRIVGEAEYPVSPNGETWGQVTPSLHMREGTPVAPNARQWKSEQSNHGHIVRSAPTLGWTDCGHDTWRPGLVLDPFAGSGTTLAAAVGVGRDAIGIDLDDRNADLAAERCGMFLEIVA